MPHSRATRPGNVSRSGTSELRDLVFEDARLLFKNFSGKAGRFNAEGERNFNLVLDPDVGESMLAVGWNVKFLEPREEGDDRLARIEVEVSYNPKSKPPKVVMVTSRGQTPLDEESVGNLDFAEFEKVDLIIHPWKWDINGKQGVKAFLKTLYATIREDPLELKYAEMADSPDSAISGMIQAADEAPF
jgi:hypothetical protein